MTATRDRRSDPDENAEPAWDERSILGKSRGLPWWGAVLLAFGLAAIAAAFDMQRQDTLGIVYQGAYVVGCVAAVCLVRRRSLFGPMVQPPLVFAVTAVAAVLLLAPDSGGSGLKSLIFTVALPLTSNFPTMGITTGVTAAFGVFRLYRERDPDAEPRTPRAGRDRPGRDRPASRGRRGDADGLDVDAPDDGRTGRRRGGAEAGSRESGGLRRGDRRSDPTAGRRGESGGRRDSSGRRGDPGDSDDPGDRRRGRSSRGADPDSEGRRGSRDRSGRDPRPDQSARDRGSDRARGGRGRRDADPAPRRRDPSADPRPRREERSRRDPSDRGAPSRRRPPEQYR